MTKQIVKNNFHLFSQILSWLIVKIVMTIFTTNHDNICSVFRKCCYLESFQSWHSFLVLRFLPHSIYSPSIYMAAIKQSGWYSQNHHLYTNFEINNWKGLTAFMFTFDTNKTHCKNYNCGVSTIVKILLR